MNKDYLILIAIGILGTMIRMITPGKIKGEVLRFQIALLAVYIMILLGVVGLLLFIVDIF